MDEVDVSSLGAFVAELDEQELGQLPAGACAEAVRQLGRARFTEIPPAVRRKKAQDALNMLVSPRPITGQIQVGSHQAKEHPDYWPCAVMTNSNFYFRRVERVVSRAAYEQRN